VLLPSVTVAELGTGWRKRGHELALGIGIAVGYATLGRIGFEGRFDYGAVERSLSAEPQPPMTLKGFQRPIPAYLVTSDQLPNQ
jgi:class 3 adenylate cyclase